MFSTRELVLKTADHFAMYPRCYRYTSNRIPQSRFEQGCVLGWMAHFCGEYQHGVLTPEVIARVTCDPLPACNVGYNDFFKRLDGCYPLYRGHWRSYARHAIAALHAYAARYPEAPALAVWARMRDREALAARRRYDQFRASLDLSRLVRSLPLHADADDPGR
jgi:citrate lyase beta subunit